MSHYNKVQALNNKHLHVYEIFYSCSYSYMQNSQQGESKLTIV